MIKHEGGMKHAPGVKCIVAVQLTEYQQQAFSTAAAAAKKWMNCDLTHIEQIDNGRIVIIVDKLDYLWKCKGCGARADMLATEGRINWEVEPADGNGPLTSAYSTCQGRGVFIQQHLLPIGDNLLLKDELLTIGKLNEAEKVMSTIGPVNGY